MITFLSFVLITISGIILYIPQRGATGDWIKANLPILSRSPWEHIHIIVGILFIPIAAFHLYHNWRTFIGYLTKKTEGVLKSRREMAAALILTVILVASSVFRLPPVFSIVSLRGGGHGPQGERGQAGKNAPGAESSKTQGAESKNGQSSESNKTQGGGSHEEHEEHEGHGDDRD